MPESNTSSAAPAAAPAPPTMSMAVAAAAAAANIYYNQPMIGVILAELPGPVTAAVPTVTQVGYAIGLFLLVPLGDTLERRRLIVTQFLMVAAASACAALAPNGWLLAAASLALGLASTAAQQIIPFAAQLAPPGRSGAVIGTVMAGLLCGILLSRTLAGTVATHAGWRATFWIAVPIALATAATMAARLPYSPPKIALSKGELFRSLWRIWTEIGELRKATVTQACLFAAFSAFWTTLAWRLQEPDFRLGADVAGWFGILGAVGILAAPLAGRLSDRYGPRRLVTAGAVGTALAWVSLGLAQTLVGLVVGVLLLDFAIQLALVSNQQLVYALRPEARSRLNTVFMGVMFCGGASGSAASTIAYHGYGWFGVVGVGGGAALLATLVQLFWKSGRRQTGA